MPDVAKLKKKAAEFELKKQFDKALAAYVEILDSYGKRSNEEVDLALYNRVGDLYLKQGNVADAVDYYEQAVDRYTEGGFFNNAIALCNKILRNSPGRASVYYKLGKISAHKGFKGDAKANFLEYADRMQQAGKIDESFRALKEFADLCPDQDDIRLMLADQLSKKGRGPEAVEQLQLLHARYTQEGRNTEARATIERMKAIDPTSEPISGGSAPRRAAGDLVFLDLDDSAPAHPPTPAPARVIPKPAPAPAPAPAPPPARPVMDAAARRATAGLDIIATGDHAEVPAPPAPAARPAAPTPPPPAPEPEVFYEPEPVAAEEPEPIELESVELEMYEPEVLDGMTRVVDFDASPADDTPSGLLDGLQSSGFDAGDAEPAGGLLDFEPTSFAEPEPPAPRPAAPQPAPAPRPVAPVPRPAPPAPKPAAPAPKPPAPAPRAAAPAPRPAPPVEDVVSAELLDFEMPDQRVAGPREVAPREVLRPPANPVPPRAASRPSLGDLPMLDDDSEQDGASGGQDLELIMPDDGGGDSSDDIPLMDLDLPMPGEATARITGSPAGFNADDLEMIDLSAPASPAFELRPEPPRPAPPRPTRPVAPPLAEVTPAELDVRAELDLDEPPISREESGSYATVDAGGVGDASGDFEAIPEQPRRNSTMLAAQSVEMLQAMAETDPEDFVLRRRLGEAMLESGDREGGLRELEAAMIGFERNDDLSSAASLADEIVRLNPGSVRHHQKRVEYAFRTNERGRLIEAYLQLADALFQVGQLEKSRAIYQRVIDLSPDDLRANAALESFPAEEAAPAPQAAAPKGRTAGASPRPAAPLKPIVTGDDEFVNLGDWLRDDEAPKDTRMVVEEKEPTGDEEADFQDMLRKFKQGIAENVEEEDHQSHYDLGVAYKEMGLLDEAIAEFQKALRGPANRVSTYEALGQCFIEKEQYPMGATILGRALQEKGVTDDQLVGVLYLLGVCAEQRGQLQQAADFYQRVFVVDIQFRDVGDRLATVESAL